MSTRLDALNRVNKSVQLPGYVPEEHQVGIVHIGLGAFHRAHQAVMTDDALAHHGGDWRIIGVSLRSKTVATELNTQNGLFTLLERGAENTSARIIASIQKVIAAEPAATLAILCEPAVRVVTLTVTEAGYGIDRETRLPDMSNTVVLADLANPDSPVGVLGLLVASLDQRRLSEVAPFTVLSCDNLPENGSLLRDGVVGFAQSAYGNELAEWIEKNVAFPCSMVDRITPAPTSETYAQATRLTGCNDKAAIETEAFSQWIIEDSFPSGRPKWEAGGAIFVDDVTAYERMKLTMLNGSHSMLAYSGFLTGNSFVRDVMRDKHLARLVQRHLHTAASLLLPLPRINYNEYAEALTVRFSNPAIAHQTFQIASDATQKLPQRIFQPALDVSRAEFSFGGNDDRAMSVRPFAFATAMWMRFCLQQHDDGTRYELQDPRAGEITSSIKGIGSDASLLSEAFHAIPNLIPKVLSQNDYWRECIAEVLSLAMSEGCIAATKNEAQLYGDLPIIKID